MRSPDRELSVDAEAVAAIRHAVSRRAAGEPVHRILGFRNSTGSGSSLSPETLEPRPDTETLVDAVLPFLRQTAAREGSAASSILAPAPAP